MYSVRFTLASARMRSWSHSCHGHSREEWMSPDATHGNRASMV